MSKHLRFDDFNAPAAGIDYANMCSVGGGCVAAPRTGITTEDILYRAATVTAIVLILITML